MVGMVGRAYRRGVHRGVGIPGRVYIGCIPPYMPPYCTWVDTSLYTSLLYHGVYAGIYHPMYSRVHHPCYTVYHDQGVRCTLLPDDGALGSTLRIVKAMRRIEASQPPKVC